MHVQYKAAVPCVVAATCPLWIRVYELTFKTTVIYVQLQAHAGREGSGRDVHLYAYTAKRRWR